MAQIVPLVLGICSNVQRNVKIAQRAPMLSSVTGDQVVGQAFSVLMRYQWLLLFAALLNSACGQMVSGGSSDSSCSSKPTDHSCSGEATAGGAIANNFQASAAIPSVFGKEIDREAVASTFSASGASLISFAETRGVRVFIVPGAMGACQNYLHYTQAPADLIGHWNHLSGAVTSSSCESRLLGLYLPKDSVMTSTKTNAALLVPSDTNKWTLTHELMHHEFDKALRLQGGYIHPDEIRAQAEPAIEALLKLAGNPTSGGAVTAGWDESSQNEIRRHVRVLAVFLPRILLQFYLEEVAVESILGQVYSSGLLHNVPDMRVDGRNYMTYAIQRSQDLVNLYKRALATLKANPQLQNSLYEEVQTEARLDQLMGEAVALLAQGPARHFREGHKSELPPKSETRCGHAGLDPKIERSLSGPAL